MNRFGLVESVSRVHLLWRVPGDPSLKQPSLHWVGDWELLYFLKVFRVEFEDLFPIVNPHGPDLYEKLQDLMASRF